MPTVSIGLGVYNGQRFLGQTLDSVLDQSFEDFELIISDNASTDATQEICRQYAARDKRISYSRNSSNIGLNNNSNRVFKLSRGRYFRWTSADDLFGRTSLEECVHALEEHPDVVLCYPQTNLINDAGEPIGEYEDSLDLRSPQPSERFRVLLQNIRLVNIHYGLMRAEVLKSTSLMRDYPGADIVFLAQLALYGPFLEIPHRLFFRRMHVGASSALKDKPWRNICEFWNPANRDSLECYLLKHRFYNVMSILRAPIGAIEKVRSLLVLTDYAFRARDRHLKEVQSVAAQLIKRLTMELNR